MSKCAAYWRAKKDGKDCGVPETKESQHLQQDYEDIIDELTSLGVNSDDAFDLIPYSLLTRGFCSSTQRGLVKFRNLKITSPIRKRMLDYLFESVTGKKKVTYDQLKKASGTDTTQWVESDFREHYKSDSATKSTSLLMKNANRNRAFNNVIKHKVLNTFYTPTVSGSASISMKLQSLRYLCTPGQMGILQQMNIKGHGDDEYAAFCIALKWALERMEEEKGNHDQLQSDPQGSRRAPGNSVQPGTPGQC